MEPHEYEIRVEGHLGESWAPWLGDLGIEHGAGGETILRGPLLDETALHGVLARIRDLGLPLLEVKRLQADETITEEGEASTR